MAQDDPKTEETQVPATGGSRRGLLRRLIGGLRGGASEQPGRLGRYRVLHRLGQGGMGVVFAAEDDSLGRRVAVKTIAEPDESARKRFRREARAAAGVNHPNVCQVYEIGEDSGKLFIAMELLEGEPLAARLSRGAMPVVEAIALGGGMLAALEALHASGIVHRDLKPSNVFLTPHGVKLLDFGLARSLPRELTQSLQSGTELTRPGLIVGTPRYMAPEQVTGRPVDERTDLFATGAILYEAVAGRPAFLGATVVEVLSATLHEQPPALTGGTEVVTLDRLLRRALAKRPEERPLAAAEMRRELEAVLAAASRGTPSLARPLTRLVVLPFRLLRPDPEVDFLSFALADAISASLAELPSVVLRSSATAARFATGAPDLKELATQAEVDLVLMGTLVRAGGQIRASTQLVEAPAGTLVSTHTQQADVDDVFTLQDELTRSIVAALSPSLGAREAAPRRAAPVSARAYDLYLRANELARGWDHLPAARDLYSQCVEADPSFAPAWAKLGRCHRLMAKYYLDEPEQNLALADAAFARALELDSALPVAHKLYAHHEAERGRARDSMVRLLGLAPSARNDPEVFAGLVHACRYCGLLEASGAAHREARRLDPHAWTSVIFTWWAQGDPERILRETSDAPDVEMRFLALHALGRREEAARLLEGGFATPLPPMLSQMIHNLRTFLEGGPAARAAVSEIVSLHTDPEALLLYAQCQASTGDVERAVGTLTRAVRGGYSVPRALEHPWLESLRGPALDALVAEAAAGQGAAASAYREAGGPELLGV